MVERERVLLQADKQMADINRRDSMLRGRGYSIRLGGSNASASQHGGSTKSLLGGVLNSEEFLLDGADDDLLLQDFEAEYCDQLLDLDDKLKSDNDAEDEEASDGEKPSNAESTLSIALAESEHRAVNTIFVDKDEEIELFGLTPKPRPQPQQKKAVNNKQGVMDMLQSPVLTHSNNASIKTEFPAPATKATAACKKCKSLKKVKK